MFSVLPSHQNQPNRTLAWLSRFLPVLDWARTYKSETFSKDLIAAVIVTIMLIPQSLAYALLAGLPPAAGLYASMLPLIAYALFGTSRVLAVGPVAVISLMTATAAGEIAQQGTDAYVSATILLAFLSGICLALMGVLRLGFLANFLSHPIISGFITASGILIAASQLKHIFGIAAQGDTLVSVLDGLWTNIAQLNRPTLAIGLMTIGFLAWARSKLRPLLTAGAWSVRSADIAVKTAPIIAVAGTTLAAWLLALPEQGVRIVGQIPSGLPPLTLPVLDVGMWGQLGTAAVLISLVGFVESVSVAQTLAAKRRERIVPDQELVGLGAANIAASLTGGYPVTGGFARSAVNFEAGAETPAAGTFTAIGILIATLAFTPLIYYLPQATLAATIIVAVLSLVDIGALKRTWDYSRSDALAMAATIVVTLISGVEPGIVVGIGLSLAIHLWRTSRPHFAIVGQVPGTEHFRNVKRHQVATSDKVVTVRVDESLYFPNARFLEETFIAIAADFPKIQHVVLMCSAVNHIDGSALKSLEEINRLLNDAGVSFHLSEVKGPVLDRLRGTRFLRDLTGQVFLSQFQAINTLAPESIR